VEPALAAGLLQDIDDLKSFLRGRVRSAGLVAAAIAAATVTRVSAGAGPGFWAEIDAETDARTASPAQRATSRQLGRSLLRAGLAAWPAPVLDALAASGRTPDANRTFGENGATGARRMPRSPESPVRGEPHHPVALGAVGAAAGCSPDGVAHVAAYLAISGPAAAAIRLRGFDPFAVQALLAALTSEVEAVSTEAVEAATGPLRDLPCVTAPRLDLLAEVHLRTELRLFAS
jgi:urease accessory protein